MGGYHFATLPYFITMCSIYLLPIQGKSRLVLLCLQGNLWMGSWFPKAQTHPGDYAVAPEGATREEGPSSLEQLEGGQAWLIRHLAPPTPSRSWREEGPALLCTGGTVRRVGHRAGGKVLKPPHNPHVPGVVPKRAAGPRGAAGCGVQG